MEVKDILSYGNVPCFVSLWEDSWRTEHGIQTSFTMVKRLKVSLAWTLKILKLYLNCWWWDEGICRGLSQLQEQTEINVISFPKDRHKFFMLMKGYSMAQEGSTQDGGINGKAAVLHCPIGDWGGGKWTRQTENRVSGCAEKWVYKGGHCLAKCPKLWSQIQHQWSLSWSTGSSHFKKGIKQLLRSWGKRRGWQSI